jgi:hypothetical protein
VSRSIRIAFTISILVVAAIYVTIDRGKTLRASRALHQVPSTARILIAIDPSAVARSASASALLHWFIDDEQLSEIELRCGLDPMRDLREIVLWVRGSERAPFEGFGLSLEGRTVNADTLAQCHRLIVGERGGSIVRLDAPSGPLLASADRRSAIALVDPDTVVTGAVGTVAEAMAVRDERLPALEERTQIAELWPRVREDAALAAVLDPPPYWRTALQRVPAFQADPSVLEGIRTIAFSAKEGSTPTVEVIVEAMSTELALRQAELVRAWAASPPEGIESPWFEVLRSARARVEETLLVTTLDLAELAAPKPRP